MTARRRSAVVLAGLLLAMLLAAGMLRDGAQAQSRQCVSDGYSSTRPVARFTPAPNPAEVDASVTFDASASRSGVGARITSYYWDLDGDGGYETVETAPTVAKRYAAAGPVEVKLVVVDECRFVSAPRTVLLEVRPDETRPALRLGGSTRLSFRTAVRRGVRVRATCSEACRLTATASVDRRTRRALRLRRARVARRTATLSSAGRRTLVLRLKLTARQRRLALRRRSGSLSVRVQAQDPAGNRSTRRRSIRLRR